MEINVRTDLASEAHRDFTKAKDPSGLSGVIAREETLNGFSLYAVEIINDKGAQALKKPVGKYYTLEPERFFARGSESFAPAAEAVAQLIQNCFGESAPASVLVAALGNPDITPDALGPLTASHLLVTRHLKHSGNPIFSSFHSLSLCRTGVLGTSGIESALHIKTLCDMLKPDWVIAIDALAGSDPERLCRTIQVNSAGVAPGSGIGNDREELSLAYLGVPVIGIGVPTVIDSELFGSGGNKPMFVTPRNIDSLVRSAARLIAYGINLAVHKGISIGDIDMLIG